MSRTEKFQIFCIKYTWIKSVYCQYNIACRQRKRVRIFFKRFVSSKKKTDLAFKIRWSKNKRKFFTLKTRHVQRSVRQAMFFCTKRGRKKKYVSVYVYDKQWPKATSRFFADFNVLWLIIIWYNCDG